MKNNFVSAIAVFLSLCLTVSPLYAATYYVSPTGAATWSNCSGSTPLNGTSACSWQTAMANALAGDIVYFRSGTYLPGVSNDREYPAMNPANSGISGNPITFAAYSGETPIIQCTALGGAAFGAGHRDYIVWDGFSGTLNDFTSGEPQLVGFWYSTGSVIKNSNLTGFAQTDHHNTALVRVERSNNVTIENNRLHDNNGLMSVDAGYLEDAMNTTAILVFFSRNLVIRNNDIYNNFLGIWDKDTEQNNQYYYNHIWGGSDYHSSCKTGIQINNQLDVYGIATGAKAYQNIVRNCSTGIYVYNDTPLRYATEMYNNTIHYGISGNGTGIMVGNTSRNAVIYNNLVIGNSLQLRYYTGASIPDYSDYNTFFTTVSKRWNLNYTTDYTTLSDWRTATGFDINSSTSNPLFINAGGANPEDYKLQAGSPALTGGRGASYALCIGAYITGNEVIGYVAPSSTSTSVNVTPPPDVTPPAKPRGFRIRVR